MRIRNHNFTFNERIKTLKIFFHLRNIWNCLIRAKHKINKPEISVAALPEGRMTH